MTADGELYIDEICRDFFKEELDKSFGENKWKLDASKFYDYWDMNTFPLRVKINVLDKNKKIIGVAEIISKANIVEGNYERYIELEPGEIKITKIKRGVKNGKKE